MTPERIRKLAHFDPAVASVAFGVESAGEVLVLVDDLGREVAAVVPPAVLRKLRSVRDGAELLGLTAHREESFRWK